MWRIGVALVMTAGMAGAEVIEDFSAGAETRWRYIADGVMGGVSQGRGLLTDEGVRLVGTVSTANNGGFIQVQHVLAEPLAATSEALVLEVRGNGETYTVFLRSRDGRRSWHNYKASFVASEEWRMVTLPFAEFQKSNFSLPDILDPTRVLSVGIAGYGKDYEADIEVRLVEVR